MSRKMVKNVNANEEDGEVDFGHSERLKAASSCWALLEVLQKTASSLRL